MESRKLETFCHNNFSEIFTKLILMLSVTNPSPPCDGYHWTITCLRNMFSCLGSVVVASSIMLDPNANSVLDTVTKMTASICYHSPQLIGGVVTGLTPYTISDDISETIKQITVTVMAVILSEKADNDSETISKVVKVLSNCLQSKSK